MSSTPANGCRGNNNSKSEDRRHLGDLIEELVSKAGPGAPAALTEEGLLKNWVSIHLHVQGGGGQGGTHSQAVPSGAMVQHRV